MTTFEDMGLPEWLLGQLQRMQFTTPTPIQAQAIPPALLGKDILGSAQTGTGKTGAFAIPLIHKISQKTNSVALVLTPTRELAMQVMQLIQKMLGHKSKTKGALLIGGESIFKQNKQLQNHPQYIVGTPGRVNDHLERGRLPLTSIDFFVLDETDRMLDMGFSSQIDSIVQHLSSERQTLLFSATLPKNIMQMTKKYLREPLRISTGENSTPKKIKQEVLHLDEGQKYPSLVETLQERQGSVLIFVNTKIQADKLAKQLADDGHSASAIHGDLRQHQRQRVINAFRKQKQRILVATDVAARGIDIPHIEHVINYDLPRATEDYVHRIGRTARADAEGSALNFVAGRDKRQWQMIERHLNPDASSTSIAKKRDKAKKKPWLKTKYKKTNRRKTS